MKHSTWHILLYLDGWTKRLARAPDKIPNLDQSEQQAIKLSFANEKVAKDNSLHLNKLGNPIAQINAKHNNAKASKLTADSMGGSPELFLCKGARVMLTRNIWTETGLCNEAMGTVKELPIVQISNSCCSPIR